MTWVSEIESVNSLAELETSYTVTEAKQCLPERFAPAIKKFETVT